MKEWSENQREDQKEWRLESRENFQTKKSGHAMERWNKIKPQRCRWVWQCGRLLRCLWELLEWTGRG